MNKNITYYFITAGLFILLKLWFTIAGNNDLMFLLEPTDRFVGLITGSNSVYFSDSGYYHDKLNILIDKSCSGFNFWILGFVVFTYLALKYFDKPLHKVLTIPAALLCAYVLTIFVNASRIYASVIVQTQTINIMPEQQHIVHEAVGIIIYLSFLVLAYYLIERFLIQHYAKLS